MPDSALQIYYNQAISFLQSMTIKFAPIANAYNATIQLNGGTIDESDETTWKYYLNLTGQYHSTDTIMTIVSLDTRETINFTVANLAENPKTAAAYVAGSPQYNALCALYPNQTDLIKSIVYPVTNINTAIAAPNFTILAFGNGLLESAEQDVVLEDLQTFLQYSVWRWYQDFLAYEDYFYWSFWGMLWQNLFLAIMSSRIKYIKTAYANTFHIWQYLASNNIGDFRNVLSDTQATFLYRNLRYLRENKGKQSNLIILADNLLSAIGVGLVGKTIFHTLTGSEDTCVWVPEIVSEPIQTSLADAVTIIPAQTVTDITIEMFDNGIDISTTADYIARQTAIMANTPVNVLTTKLLEIQQLGLDTKYAQILNNFIVDMLVDTINAGVYNPLVTFVDTVTGTNIILSGKEALVLYYFCIYKSLDQIPVNLPNLYTPSTAYKRNISNIEIPTTFGYNGVVYNISDFFNITDITSRVIYPTIPITTGTNFSNLVGNLFTVLIESIRFSRTSADLLTFKAIHTVYKSILQNSTYSLILDTQYTVYSAWLADINHNYVNMVAQYDASADPKTNYTNLAQAIMNQLIPLTNTTVLKYVDNSDAIRKLYIKIKQLFVMLCSYNVTFLDTQGSPAVWFMTDVMAMSVTGSSGSQEISIDPGLAIKVSSKHVLHDEYRMSGLDVETKRHSVYPVAINPGVDTTFVLSGSRTIRAENLTTEKVTSQTVTTKVKLPVGPRMSVNIS